ncbi:Pyridine nucleotide-disulfide oxidoreductase-like protein 8 [Elsinoe fawcettii]|nr:Pyridine nucleotide-disulfide oxidoreductase-like protein 8 [Elsinoe fawcettii]
MPSKETKYDLVVVGAGWFGLASAKAYLELHPSENILVIESAKSCGGTWGNERLYPGLKSNNIAGSYEYPDFRMSEEVYGVKDGDHIPAATLHRYLTDYAKKFGVFSRTVFETKVNSIEPTSTGGWKVSTTAGGSTTSFETEKIILATGLTSEPNMLSFPGEKEFGAPFFHAKDFYVQSATLKNSKNAVILGGAKSALDVAYAYVQEGVTVDLVIRPDGKGPVWLAPPYVTPLKKKTEELLHTRFLSWFSPCPWGDEDGFGKVRRWLHSTAVGRWIVSKFWHQLGSDVVQAHAFDSHPETAKLKPWNSAFWIASGLSIHNYQTNIFDLVKAGKIRVHIANVSHLSPHTVHLSTGASLPADVLIAATGWKKEASLKYLNFEITLPLDDIEIQKLSSKADAEVLSRFPALKNQPTLRFKPDTKDPLRLYRFMVPTQSMGQRNIAFAGAVSTVSTSICAAVQGLWISAYFDGKVQRIAATETEAIDEAVLHSQWGKWRYPCGYGATLPDLAFDCLPYFDLLIKDLGLKNHRKSSRWAELTEPYKPWDYDTLVEEYQAVSK